MPKLVEVINDFSGGLAKGYSPENLQNNQMVKCDNLIADGIGKLSTVPNTETKSTSDVIASLPVYNAKNIHTWSSDTTLTVQDQASNVMSEPTTSEVKRGFRARFLMIMTRSSENSSPSIAVRDLGRNDDIVFHWQFPLIKGFEGPQQALGKTLRGLDVNINHDEANTSMSYSGISFRWLTHAEMDALFPESATSNDQYTTMKVAFKENPELDDAYFSWSSYESDYHNGGFKVSAIKENDWTDNSTESWALRTCAEFDYWGPLNLEMTTNGLDKRRPSGNLRFVSGASNNGNDNMVIGWGAVSPSGITVNPFANGPDYDDIGDSTDGASENRILYSHMESSNEFAYLWGQYSRWDYVLTGLANNEIATYNLDLILFTNAEHSTEISIQVSHVSEPGETAESIKSSLLSKLIEKVELEAPDQMISYEWKEDGSGFEIYQDELTPQPFAIKSLTSTKTNVTTQSDIQVGQNFSDLLVLASENASANIYSLSSDNWLDYPLDCRINKDLDYNTPLVFSDTEGYLKVADQYFYNNSIPKWFGFLDLNSNIYVNNTFDVSGAFYDDNMTPMPFKETVSGGELDGQHSHVFVTNNTQSENDTRFFRIANEHTESVDVELPQFGEHTPHASGLKLWVDWIDGANTGTSWEKLDGSFTKKEDARFYYVYKYHGGAISQPRYLHNMKAGQTAGNSPREDNVALGLSLSVGSNMINGDGNDMINVRLKGIEIYGYFPKHDSNNIYLLLEVDLKRGWKSVVTGDWAPLVSIENNSGEFNSYSTCDNGNVPQSSVPIFKTHPPISFNDIYGISWNKPIGFDVGGTGFRTACIYNRRAYYGNIRIKGEDETITYYPDGVVKSVKGYYDAVSVDNLVEATINDGDEITCLRVAGNKLMQFKKKSLTIMGIKELENGESREVIEQTIDHCGVSGANQVAETPYGLFWVTRSGIYIFDGNKMDKLTENLRGSTISKTEWEDFYGPRTHVGYDAYWNHAHICKDTQDNPKTLIYAFNTRAFTESNKLYASDHKTGFVNDREGHLLWAQIGTGSNSITTNSNNNPRLKDKVQTLPQMNQTNDAPT